MKKVSLRLFITILMVFVIPYVLCAQQVEAPVYRDGDWWKIKVEVSHTKGLMREGRCDEMYSEYVVKIGQGNPKVYGVKADGQEELDCPIITTQLLGKPSEGEESLVKYLEFPLAVGRSWTSRFPEQQTKVSRKFGTRTRWIELEHNTLSWEKVRVPKGELEAFKIQVSGWPGGEVRTYYYAPKAKAIIGLQWISPQTMRRMNLVDFNASE